MENLVVSETSTEAPSRRRTIAPILSFFSGMGLLDLGFGRADFESIWHNELNPNFVEGFNYGMGSLGASGPSSRIQNSHSILEAGPNQVLKEAFGTAGKPELMGIIGGPPCPDFSVGGKNKGHTGDHGKLSQVFVSRILEILPSFFLFENVPGLLRTQKHRAFLLLLLDQLARHYRLDLSVVNALEFGVPQDRERVILVGLSNKWLRRHDRKVDTRQSPRALVDRARGKLTAGDCPDLAPHWMPWDSFRSHPGAKKAYDWPDTSPFGENPPCPRGMPRELMVGPLITDTARLSRLPNGTEGFKPKSRRFKTVAEGDVSRKSFKRLHRWRFSPACAYGNNEVHLHPVEPRRLTVREALQIQTVPEQYALPPSMTLSSKFKTIGNAVPVMLAAAMARSIAEVIDAVQKGRACGHL